MKYKEDYFLTGNKEEFISLFVKKYKLKKATAVRRWYELKQRYGPQKPNLDYEENEIKEPDRLKKLQFADMRRYGYKFHKKKLLRYGFTRKEINWIENELRKDNEEMLE